MKRTKQHPCDTKPFECPYEKAGRSADCMKYCGVSGDFGIKPIKAIDDRLLDASIDDLARVLVENEEY